MVLEVPTTMTGDYAARDAQAQEFGASFRAREVASLTSGSIPRATANPAIASCVVPGLSGRLPFSSLMEEMS